LRIGGAFFSGASTITISAVTTSAATDAVFAAPPARPFVRTKTA
jgi:hypothetical protein